MIFLKPTTLGYYLPKSRFSAQNALSKKIISLKNGDLSAVLYFYNILKYRFSNLEGEVILCTVPTSHPDKPNPLNKVVERLCGFSRNFKNGCDLLQKLSPTQSLCKGGHRDFYDLKETFGFRFILPIHGKTLVILDDVVTTGVSINAARAVLLENGAKSVIPFALGLTAMHVQFTKTKKAQTPAGAYAV